jgi:hypothetical protein
MQMMIPTPTTKEIAPQLFGSQLPQRTEVQLVNLEYANQKPLVPGNHLFRSVRTSRFIFLVFPVREACKHAGSEANASQRPRHSRLSQE